MAGRTEKMEARENPKNSVTAQLTNPSTPPQRNVLTAYRFMRSMVAGVFEAVSAVGIVIAQPSLSTSTTNGITLVRALIQTMPSARTRLSSISPAEVICQIRFPRTRSP